MEDEGSSSCELFLDPKPQTLNPKPTETRGPQSWCGGGGGGGGAQHEFKGQGSFGLSVKGVEIGARPRGERAVVCPQKYLRASRVFWGNVGFRV